VRDATLEFLRDSIRAFVILVGYQSQALGSSVSRYGGIGDSVMPEIQLYL